METKIFYTEGDRTKRKDLFEALFNDEIGHMPLKNWDKIKPETHLVVLGKIGVNTLATLYQNIPKEEGKSYTGDLFLPELPYTTDNRKTIESLARTTGRTVVFTPQEVSFQINRDSAYLKCMAVKGEFQKATPDENGLVEIKNCGRWHTIGQSETFTKQRELAGGLGKAPTDLTSEDLNSLQTPGAISIARDFEESLSRTENEKTKSSRNGLTSFFGKR